MSLEVTLESSVCFRCGKKYGQRKSNFPVSYASMYKGLGYLPICKSCVESMYNSYLEQCQDPKKAVRQMCRKLDLYWNENIFDKVMKKNTVHTIITQYIARTNSVSLAGRCYDDTLSSEGSLWKFDDTQNMSDIGDTVILPETEESDNTQDIADVSDEVKDFWGPGYTRSMYLELEQRRQYWMSKMPPEVDIGTEAIIRQICSLEIDINKDRAAGKSVDKNINALNTLLGSANLKPVQQKDDVDTDLEKMPLGVGIQKWEDYRPLPPVKENQKDVNKHIKTVLVWFTGHLCKMAGVKHAYSRMYEEEIERLRVKRPDIDEDDDDEEFLSKFFDDGSGGDG